MVQSVKLDTNSNWASDLDKVDSDSWASQLDTVQDDSWASDLDPKPTPISPEPDVSSIASALHRESIGEVVEEFPDITVPTVGLKSVLGRDIGEVDLTQPGPLISEESKENFMNNLNRVWSLAKNPYDVIKGTAELVTQIPGFMLSTIPAMRSTFEKQQSHDTLLDLYNDFWEELEGNMEVWQKYITGPVGRVFDTPRKVRDRLRKSLLGADPEERRGDESEMIGEMFMAPYTVASGSIGEIADDPFFDDSPNWRGGIKIFGDAIGFAFMGSFYRGGRQALSRDLEPLVKKGVELKERQTKIDVMPDEVLKRAEQEILNMEKKQAELYAAEVMKKQDYDKMIKEDLGRKETQIKQIKQPKREILDEAVDKALREKDRSKIELSNNTDLRVKLANKYNLDPHSQLVLGTEYRPDGTTAIILQNLYIPKAVRRTGVGTKIIKDIQAHAKKTGQDIVATPLEGYVREFFDSLGFEKVDGNYVWKVDRPKIEPSVEEPRPPELKLVEKPKTPEGEWTFQVYMKDDSIWTGKAKGKNWAEAWERAKVKASKHGEVGQSEKAKKIHHLTKLRAEVKPELVTDLDLQTGTREPIQLSTENSPFRQKPKKTELLDGLMRDRKSVARNVNELIDVDPNLPTKNIDVTTSKLLNDVNKWLDGKEVDIGLTRDFLSELATRSGELRRLFENEAEFVRWKETVSEAAVWARKADRLKVEQPGVTLSMGVDPAKAAHLAFIAYAKSKGFVEKIVGDDAYSRTRSPKSPSVKLLGAREGKLQILERGKRKEISIEPSIDLNMMIPLDKIPQAAIDFYKGIKKGIRFRKIFRDEGLFDATGFWLGKDGKWRFEIDDSTFKLKTTSYGPYKLDQRIDHPQLFKAMPEMRNVRTYVDDTMPSGTGVYSKVIEGSYIRVSGRGDYTNVRSTLLHEVQHAVNREMEAFPGTSTKAAGGYEGYRIDPGEMEARLTERRHGMGTDARRLEPPWETLDKMLREEGLTPITKEWDDFTRKPIKDVKKFNREMASIKRFDTTIGEKLYSGIPLDRAVRELVKTIKPKWDKDSTSWKFEVRGMLQEIYRDPESGWWMDAQRLTPGSNRPLYLGDTKIEATRKSVELAVESIRKLPGVELYDITGVPLDKVIEQIRPMAKRAKEFYDEFSKSMKAKDFALPYAMKKLKIDSVQAALEQSETLMKYITKKYGEAGYRVVQRQRAAAAGSGYGRVVYDQIISEIFKGKSAKMVDVINNYILARRFRDIYGYRSEKYYKHQKGYGSEQSVSSTGIIETLRNMPEEMLAKVKEKVPEVKEMFGDLTAKEMAEVIRSGESFFEHTRKMIDDAVAAEIKTPEEGVLLKAHDFRKFKTLNIETLFDAVRKTKLGNRTIKATDSGIESLGHGSTKMLDPDARVSLMEMTGRLYGSAANNVAKLAWRDLAEKYPDNAIVSTKSVHKWSSLPYFDKGKQKNLYFHPDAAKHLVLQSHDISRRFSKVAQWFFLAPVTRTLAVGASPSWATFVGFPMDVMHSLFTAKTFDVVKGKKVPIYGPFAPAYPFRMGKDLARTFSDTFHRGPLFKEYAKYGGMMPFLSQRQSRYLKGTKPPGQFAKFMDVITYHGASMELWVRHAIADRVIRNRAKEQGITYEAAVKNKDIMYEAVHTARERMDYNQGGWMIKAADQSGLIFLNAGVLGARKFWAGMIENPVDFTFKAAQIGIAATGITATAALLYPEIWKEIPKEGNERNITFPLFPNWISFKDRNGNTRHFYVKMRMDPGGAFFYKAFSTLTQTYLYDKGLIKEEPDYREVVETLKLQLPVDTKFPPAAQMGIDYYTNYSWWKERKMYTEAGGKTFDWPKSAAEGVYDHERGLRDPSISQLAADVGQVTKLSPKRLQGSIGNVFPRGNEFVYLFGKAYETAFDDIPEGVRKEHFLMTLARFPGINRVIGITIPEYDRRVRRDKAEEEELLETVVRNGELDSITKAYYWHGAGSYKDVAGVLAKQKDIDIFESMERRVKFIEDVKDLGHRNYWVSMYHSTPKAKARDYVETYNRASEQERKELLLERAELDAIGGYITDKFLEEEAKLKMYGPTPQVQRE